MQNRRFVTIPKKFVQGKEKSYTGYDFLLICPPSEAGLPSCVLEVPEFLAEEAPGGGLTIFEGTMPFLCRRKDPPKGTRSKRYRWIVDEIEVVYAREIAEMDRAREKRAERRLAALRGPGALVVAWHNELDSVDSGVAFFRKGLSVGLVPAGSKWMYDLDSYDPWSPSGTKGRHGRAPQPTARWSRSPSRTSPRRSRGGRRSVTPRTAWRSATACSRASTALEAFSRSPRHRTRSAPASCSPRTSRRPRAPSRKRSKVPRASRTPVQGGSGGLAGGLPGGRRVRHSVRMRESGRRNGHRRW